MLGRSVYANLTILGLLVGAEFMEFAKGAEPDKTEHKKEDDDGRDSAPSRNDEIGRKPAAGTMATQPTGVCILPAKKKGK
jgi:hypothetical protein